MTTTTRSELTTNLRASIADLNRAIVVLRDAGFASDSNAILSLEATRAEGERLLQSSIEADYGVERIAQSTP